MILGPTVNIARVPVWGRNFEGYGEDPFLTGQLGAAYVQGVQGEGVISTLKHFAANNAEYERRRIDETIDERALQEIYFPAFKAGVEAGVWSIMSAYNKVNGDNCSENEYLLTEVLRNQWGFKGFVVSDWGSTYSTAKAINAGLNLEMPGGDAARAWLGSDRAEETHASGLFLTPDKVMTAASAGGIMQETIDEAVRPILRVMFSAGLFDQQHTAGGVVETEEHKALAREAANETLVLLKNAGDLLPLDPAQIRSVAVIGPNGDVARTGGGGSSLVRPNYSVTPLDGINEIADEHITVNYALGVAMAGEDPAQDTPQVREQLRTEAVEAAKKSDAAVIVVGYSSTLETEGSDRSMDLPAGQDDLIRAVAAANENTIVVIQSGGPVTMTDWIGQTPAIVQAWYGGQEAGHAIADVLFGVVNPSGRLPVTFPKQMRDSPAYGNYPGENLQVTYAEGIYVGYRGFDKNGTEPEFPFGHGLSYTTFTYSGLEVTPAQVKTGEPVTVTFQVENTGSVAGAEIAQVYLHDVESSIDRPEKELKGFGRVTLQLGETQTITVDLDEDAMSFYSPAKEDWVSEPGAFEVLVGSSSRDIRLKGTFELAE